MRINIESNPLHFAEFSHIGQMEAEIIKIYLDLYNAPLDGCGLQTSGGTESIFLTCVAYRQWGKNVKRIKKANIVASNTVHAGFDKACFYLGIELRKIQLNNDLSCDFDTMREKIDSNTVLVVASCPDFAHGKFDPVHLIASLALEKDIGCHLDCCLGGLINVFAEEAGFKLPYTADFRMPGVTSISTDPHKFAYAPKGSSILLFANKDLRRCTFIPIADWQGGMYLTPT